MSAFQIIFCVFLVFGSVYSTLSDVDRACIDTYSAPLDNDYLIGTWYETYKFGLFLNPIPSSECTKTVITNANSSEIQRYIAAYTLDNPYSFNDNPVLVDRNDGYYEGMMVGNNQVKFHVYDPDTNYYNEKYYEARVYQRINDDYMLYHRCALRANTKWLMSKKNDATVDELNEIIRQVASDVNNMDRKRYCA